MSVYRLPCTPPLDVAPSHASEFELVAMAVREQTLALYRDHLQGAAVLSSTQWKHLKRKDKVDVFLGREQNPPTAFHCGLESNALSDEIRAAADWVPQLKLRLVGQTHGSLDDAMFGAAAPTELAMMMRSAATGDEFTDHRTLLDIRVPTANEPFTYTGLKWSARSTAIAGFVKARDVSYIEASGFTTIQRLGRQERIGFTVQHSVKLPELPSLESQGVVRSRFSLCTLFRQASPGVVEMFSTLALHPGGDVASKAVVNHATEALFGVAKMPASGLQKKLVWSQSAHAQGAPQELAQHVPARKLSTVSSSGSSNGSTPRSKTRCELCARSLSALRSVTACAICENQVCSRCISSHKLVYGIQKNDVRLKSVSVCGACLTAAQEADNAPVLAVYEFVKPFEKAPTKREPFAATERARIESLATKERTRMQPFGVPGRKVEPFGIPGRKKMEPFGVPGRTTKAEPFSAPGRPKAEPSSIPGRPKVETPIVKERTRMQAFGVPGRMRQESCASTVVSSEDSRFSSRDTLDSFHITRSERTSSDATDAQFDRMPIGGSFCSSHSDRASSDAAEVHFDRTPLNSTRADRAASELVDLQLSQLRLNTVDTREERASSDIIEVHFNRTHSPTEVDRDSVIEVHFDRTPSPPQYHQQTDPLMDHRMRLWQQMNELCAQAENTYLQTKQQANFTHR